MRLTPELRSALRSIGNAAIGVALGMSLLGIAFVVSQFAMGQGSIALAPLSSAAPLVNAGAILLATATPPPPSPTLAQASSTPSAAPTDPPATPTPTPTPAPSPEEFTVAAYANSGKRYAALTAPVGYVYKSPFAGTVQVLRYQLINGDVRVGSLVPSLPFYPYVIVSSADRRVTYRPGALDVDTEMIVVHGDTIEPGAALFKTIGDGASSWRSFYDRGVTANVIVSVAALPSGAELDPVAFFTTR